MNSALFLIFVSSPVSSRQVYLSVNMSEYDWVWNKDISYLQSDHVISNPVLLLSLMKTDLIISAKPLGDELYLYWVRISWGKYPIFFADSSDGAGKCKNWDSSVSSVIIAVEQSTE